MTKLRSCGNQWSFYNESELEECIWTHLTNLFGLLPLKRQYSINGQFCDILAATSDQQLVVIELKNEVDRYVVQQLTRYYHALQQECPFSDQIDYSKLIRLIAIAPSFHRDNLIDQQYNRLAIEFLQFEIVNEQDHFIWRLQHLETQQTWHLQLSSPTQNSSWDIPPAPRKLLNKLVTVDDSCRTRILKIRQKLLEFDDRMKEIVLSAQLVYGKGKSLPCAEFRFGSPLRSGAQPNMPNLLLRLPHPERKQMCRMVIRTRDWDTVEQLYYCPSGGRVQLSNAFWQKPVLLLKAFQEWEGDIRAYGVEHYQKLLENPDRATSIELWLDIALEHWSKKL